jgi:hypothetical protein
MRRHYYETRIDKTKEIGTQMNHQALAGIPRREEGSAVEERPRECPWRQARMQFSLESSIYHRDLPSQP